MTDSTNSPSEPSPAEPAESTLPAHAEPLNSNDSTAIKNQNSKFKNAAASPSAAPPVSDADPIKNRPGHHARTGKVARLPKAVRDRINLMLDDALPYNQIIRQLGDDGQQLEQDHIRRWKTGGYQDYLRQQRLVDECRARSDRALDLLRQLGPIHGFQAAQQIAAAQICETLADAGADFLRDALAASPLNYFRMLNAFSRITAGGLKCERHLADEAQRSALQQPAAKKGLSPAALKEMNDKLHLL